MKFAHLADCHVGAWREPRMRDLTVEAFRKAILLCIDEQVDFVLIAGDLFHTAIPPLECVKAVFRSLRGLKDAGIPLYFITGSHDYSPTGKTMLDLVEEADLGRNVFRGSVHDGVLRLNWTTDPKTHVKLAGILGRANQLDSEIYTTIDRAAAAAEQGTKIFLFHTGLEELTPSAMSFDHAPLSMLPDGCSYYAGGHVHVLAEERIGGKHLVYPGPVFPASFSELEDLSAGGFVIVDNWQVRRIRVETKRVLTHTAILDGMTPIQTQAAILDALQDVRDSIVLVRARGTLQGKPSDIPWRPIADELQARGAYVLLRNTVELTHPKLEQTMIATGTLDDIERSVLEEHKFEPRFARELMDALSSDLQDGEKRQAYEDRIAQAAAAVLAKKQKQT